MRIVKKIESGTIIDELSEIPINSELNRNVLIVGSSGSGKSFLGRILRDQQKPDITFIYKEDTLYDKMTRIAEKRELITPNIDKTAFIDAFTEAQNLSEIGIMGSSLSSILNEIYHEGNIAKMKMTLRTLKAKKGIDNMVYNYILAKLSMYYPERNNYPQVRKTPDKQAASISPNSIMTLKEERIFNIISYYGLTQEEQIYFSDYILRIIMLTETEKRREILQGIMIDEIHRLKQLNSGIISEIVREIRHRGYIIGITQSLTDLPDSLVNNFGTIFQFHSIHFQDLEKLRTIDPELPQTVLRLKAHEFIEVQRFVRENRNGHRFIYEAVE